MRICLVGGIFDKDRAYQQVVRITPETTLLSGLRERGHHIVAQGHYGAPTFDAFDVVHVHHFSWGALAAASHPTHARFVYTHHGMATDSLGRRIALRRVMRAADAVIALTPTEAAWQRNCLRVSSDRQHVIPNGIDETLFVPAPTPAVPGPPWRLLYVGQLIPLKGVSILFQACAQLAAQHPVVLRLAYQVDSDLPLLRKQARALGLHVDFLPMQTPEQLATLYADSHVVVLPSLSEALPAVISEAMMVGRPVVATEVGGIPDQLGGLGRLVRPNDVTALAEGLADVLAHYSEWSGRARKTCARARERFGASAMVSRHEDLYEAVLARPRAATPPVADAVIYLGARAATRARQLTRPASRDGAPAG